MAPNFIFIKNVNKHEIKWSVNDLQKELQDVQYFWFLFFKF